MGAERKRGSAALQTPRKKKKVPNSLAWHRGFGSNERRNSRGKIRTRPAAGWWHGAAAMRALALALAVGPLAACSWGEPDIDVVSSYDAGTVVKGSPAIADLTVRNLGDRPLHVTGVSTSCGCTKATLSAMVIPPGGSAGLHLVYDSSMHEEDIGLIERFIFVSSDDPDEDDVRIKFTVTVSPKPV